MSTGGLEASSGCGMRGMAIAIVGHRKRAQRGQLLVASREWIASGPAGDSTVLTIARHRLQCPHHPDSCRISRTYADATHELVARFGTQVFTQLPDVDHVLVFIDQLEEIAAARRQLRLRWRS